MRQQIPATIKQKCPPSKHRGHQAEWNTRYVHMSKYLRRQSEQVKT